MIKIIDFTGDDHDSFSATTTKPEWGMNVVNCDLLELQTSRICLLTCSYTGNWSCEVVGAFKKITNDNDNQA